MPLYESESGIAFVELRANSELHQVSSAATFATSASTPRHNMTGKTTMSDSETSESPASSRPVESAKPVSKITEDLFGGMYGVVGMMSIF